MTLVRTPSSAASASASSAVGFPRGATAGALKPDGPATRMAAANGRPSFGPAPARATQERTPVPPPSRMPSPSAQATPVPASRSALGMKARLARVRLWGPFALAVAFALATGVFAGAAGAQWRATRLAGVSETSLNEQQVATLQWLQKLHPELPAPSQAARENEADYHAWLDKALAKLRPADSATSGQNPVFTASDAFELARLAVEVSRADVFLARDNQAGGGSSYAPGIREEAATAMLRQLWKENHAWDLQVPPDLFAQTQFANGPVRAEAGR